MLAHQASQFLVVDDHALLTQRGVSWEIALTTTALVRLTTLWFSVALGMSCLPLAMRRATRGTTA